MEPRPGIGIPSRSLNCLRGVTSPRAGMCRWGAGDNSEWQRSWEFTIQPVIALATMWEIRIVSVGNG
jgi:hypothetical protein